MMDSLLSSLIALTTLSLFSVLPAGAQTPSFGPLSTEEGGPLLRMSYTPMTESPDPVEVGAFAASLWSGFSNVFEQDSSATHWLFLDMERVLTAMTVRYGIAQDLEIGGRITLETNGDGVLDPAIVWWHTKLHFGNANRDRYAHDRYEQRLEREGQLLLDVDQGLLSLEDIRLFAKWRVISNDSGTGALSLRAVTRIPTNPNRVGAEAGDVAVMALGRTPMDKWVPADGRRVLGTGEPRAQIGSSPGQRLFDARRRTELGRISCGSGPIHVDVADHEGLRRSRDRWARRQPHAGAGRPLERRVALGRELPGRPPGRHARGRLHARHELESTLVTGADRD